MADYAAALVGVLPVAALMWAAANGAFALGGELSLALMLMIVVLAGVLLCGSPGSPAPSARWYSASRWSR